MINKGVLLKRVYLTLGLTTKYNDNSDKRRANADLILNSIIEELANNESFQFNQTTQKLTYYQNNKEKNDNGYYVYNIPPKLLNITAPNTLKIENEFILSEVEDLEIRYNYQVALEELPDYLFGYLRFRLCYELSLTYSEFRPRQEEFMNEYLFEEDKIRLNEWPLPRNTFTRTVY